MRLKTRVYGTLDYGIEKFLILYTQVMLKNIVKLHVHAHYEE